MALRLVYQISCNVKNPTLIQSTCTTSVRRFRSLSPIRKTVLEEPVPVEQPLWRDVPRQSFSCSSFQDIFKAKESPAVCIPKMRSISQERDNEDKPENKLADWKDIAKNRHKIREVQQISADQYVEEGEEGSSWGSTKTKPKNVSSVRKNAEQKLNQYRLQDSIPRKRKDFYNVYGTHMREHIQKGYKVLPHLQPNKLQPYGTGNNLTFPYQNNKRFEITYPAPEPGYVEQVSKNYAQKQPTGKENKQRRGFSTNLDHDLLENEAKGNQTGQANSSGFFMKTMKMFTGFSEQQDNSTSKRKKIKDIKPLNPVRKLSTHEVRPGNVDERDTVMSTLNFVATYKKRYTNPVFDKTISHQGFLCKSKSASELQSRGHHAGNEIKPTTFSTEVQFHSESAKPVVIPVSETPAEVLETVKVPVKVRMSTTVDLLQSNAAPETMASRQGKPLDKNERLVSPWPSYAETRKRGSTTNSYFKRCPPVTYPPIREEKTLKSAINQEIKSEKTSKPTPNTNTRSLHQDTSAELVSSKLLHNAIRKAKYRIVGSSCLPKGARVAGTRSFTINSHRHHHFKRFNSSSSKGKREKPSHLNSFPDICNEKPPNPTPNFDNIDCPCVKLEPPKFAPPLNRPTKRREVKEPSKICRKPPACPARADASYKLKAKKLPRIQTGMFTPCTPPLKKGSSLPRLKKAQVKDPPRVCPCSHAKCDCPPRADDGLEIEKKALPELVPNKCPKASIKCPVNVPPLKRLPKVEIAEPPKELPPKVRCGDRADDGLAIERKTLPQLEAKDCPRVEAEPLKDFKIKRLKKFKWKDAPRDCYRRNICDETVRSDDVCEYQPKPKKLPAMILKAKNNHVSIHKFKKIRDAKKFSTWSGYPQNQSFFSMIINPLKILQDVSSYTYDLMKTSYYSTFCSSNTSTNCTADYFRVDIPQRSSDRAIKRSESNLVYEKGIKTQAGGLPFYATSYKIHHPARSSFCPRGYEKVFHRSQQMLSTSAAVFKKNPSKPPKKKPCPKIRMPGCKERGRQHCVRDYPFKKYEKNYPPYPSFSEYGGEHPVHTPCGCGTVEQPKFLQPKHPFLEELAILKAPDCDPVTENMKEECLVQKGEEKAPSVVVMAREPAGNGSCTPSGLPCKVPSPCGKKPKKGLFARIIGFFRARPNCPQPGEWKQKQLEEQARKAAKAAGMMACPDPCAPKKKPPTKKGVTKAKGNSFRREKNSEIKGSHKKMKDVSQKTASKAPETTKSAVKVSESAPKTPKVTGSATKPAKAKKSDYAEAKAKRCASKQLKTKESESKQLKTKKSDYAEAKAKRCASATKTRSEPSVKASASNDKSCTPPETKKSAPSICKKASTSSTPKCKPKMEYPESCPAYMPNCTPQPSSSRKDCEPPKDPCKKEDPCKKKKKKPSLCVNPKDKKPSLCKSDKCKPKKKKDPCPKPKPSCPKPKKKSPCCPKPKKKDPCKKEDPCKKKENPCKKKCQPAVECKNPCKKDKKPPCPKTNPCEKKKDPCKPKKEDPCKKKEDPCKPKKKCEKIDLEDCPERQREHCQINMTNYKYKPCKTQVTPYPSFSEIHPPFQKAKETECVVAKKRSKDTLKNIKMTEDDRDDTCTEEENNENAKEDKKGDRGKPDKGRRTYSTTVRPQDEWQATLSSSSKQENLSERLLAGIEDGIRRLERQDSDLSNNAYYKILKILEKLSENEINEFFGEEPQFNPFGPLRRDVRETVSFVCKLDPRAETNLLDFEPRCARFSDVNSQLEEVKMLEAFKSLCNKISQQEMDYEESERRKTEKMREHLNELLHSANRNN